MFRPESGCWHGLSDIGGLREREDLRFKFKWGAASKTDAVLTRHFNPRTGAESRERQVTIFLREGQAFDDLVLDIAHELVHATSRPGWDPYDPRLTPGKYIWAAIEGEGGEVQAVAMECRVGFEVHSRFGAASSAVERCKSYLSSKQAGLDEELIRRDFYRVGHWDYELDRKLGPERSLFPLLSRETPKLYSSTGNAPYPVALFREFEEITQIACRELSPACPGRPGSCARRTAKKSRRLCCEALRKRPLSGHSLLIPKGLDFDACSLCFSSTFFQHCLRCLRSQILR